MADGVALLRLGDIGDPETVHPNLAAVDAGVYRLSLYVPMADLEADPLRVLRFLEGQLGAVLHHHDDPRGVYIYEDGATPDGYDAALERPGFWAAEPPPEPVEEEGPSPAEQAVMEAEQALASLARTVRSRAKPATGDPRQDAARRFAALAEECRRAAEHLARTAAHFRDGDVPRASAHRVAAEGHLVRVRRELDALAVLHAEHAG